ncbi:MAG: transposase [Candidatus Iainarchaeum sp.]|jgi:transposase
MKTEVTKCFRCGSEKIVRRGKQFNTKKTLWKQRWQCKNCRHKFVEKKEHLVDYEPEPFEYKPKGTTPIDWSKYNEAQLNEKLLFLEICNDLLDMFEFKQVKTNGRPVKNTKDILFSMLVKVYNKNSSRRTISDLELLKKLGYIQEIPCFSTLMNYFNNKDFQQILEKIIELSALPFKEVETDFASDATGFSSSQFGRWFNHKWGKETEKRVYRKLHAMIGVRSNVITHAIVTKQEGRYTGDTSQFRELVKKTAINFTIKEVSADMAYSSRQNLETISELGGMPFIPFKKNTKSKGFGSSTWKNMHYYFKQKPQEFYEHYHKRSNVETTFAMIKQKFSGQLLTKNWQANVNEILGKCICHNIYCLIKAYYLLNVEKTISTEVLNQSRIQVLV